MSDDIYLGAISALDGIDVSPEAEKEDVRIPVGSTYQTGAGVVDRYQTLSQMQANVLSWAANRSPEYATFAQNMVDAGFLPESAIDQPTSAANNLQYPVQVFQAYRAGGGTMVFNEWFDWYSSSAKAAREDDSGSGGGFAGPTRSITRMNQSDIETSADNVARDTIGRGLRKKETAEAVEAMREAETSNPTVSRVSGDTRVTEQGLSEDERRKILQQVIKDNPDFVPYQFDTTVLDAIGRQIEKAQEMFNG